MFDFKLPFLHTWRTVPKPKFAPKKYVLFNVDTFNTWFNSPNNDAEYAHPGIFLRLDKLSECQIKDYLVKCHNLDFKEWDVAQDITEFYDAIRQDWIKKINEKITQSG